MSEYQSKHTGEEIDDGIDDAQTALQPGDVVDNLTSTDTDKPLSANQGKVLKDSQVSVGDIVNNLTSTATDRPLAAAQGKILQDTKAPKESPTFTGTVTGVTKAMVGLGNVDNTSDANKPISTATQAEIDAQVDTLLGRKNQIAQGFVSREGVRGDLDVDLAVAIELNLIGAPVVGGFYAGIIDTIKGDIIAADAYQTGARYALIVSPKDLEAGPGKRWFVTNTGDANGADTRWDGLAATDSILALEDDDFEAHSHIADVRASDPPPATPGGSDWYMPAMDELELLYRNFKPNDEDNRTDSAGGETFPGVNQFAGVNPSSDPQGVNYENSPRIPDETFLALFKENADESIDQGRYWSTTWAATGRAWGQNFTPAGFEGRQITIAKLDTLNSVRPVRRVVLQEGT